MQDAWRAYLELALGLTEASRKKAREVAKELLGRGEATASQVQSVVDDMLSTSRANREGLVRLVRYEVDRALGAVGLATADEVAELTSRLRELERRLNKASSGAPAPAGTRSAGTDELTERVVVPPRAARPVAKKTVAKKTVAKKTAAKKSAARKRAVPKSAG